MIKTNVPKQPIGNVMDAYSLPDKGSDTYKLIQRATRKQILKNIEKRRNKT